MDHLLVFTKNKLRNLKLRKFLYSEVERNRDIWYNNGCNNTGGHVIIWNFNRD